MIVFTPIHINYLFSLHTSKQQLTTILVSKYQFLLLFSFCYPFLFLLVCLFVFYLFFFSYVFVFCCCCFGYVLIAFLAIVSSIIITIKYYWIDNFNDLFCETRNRCVDILTRDVCMKSNFPACYGSRHCEYISKYLFMENLGLRNWYICRKQRLNPYHKHAYIFS